MNIKLQIRDGFMLDGILNKVPNSQKGIILAHGMTVDKDDEGIFVQAEPLLNKLGFSTLRFDFRAHGKSSGDPAKDFTVSGELIDLETAVDFMKEEGITWLGLAGASFGGGVASLYVGSNPNRISALFLANPVLDYQKAFLEPKTWWGKKYFTNYQQKLKKDGFVEVGTGKYKLGKQIFEEFKKYFPYQSLEKYQGKLLIVHGDLDNIIDVQDSIDCFNKLSNKNKKLEIIKGAWHGFHTKPFQTKVTEMLVKFFS